MTVIIGIIDKKNNKAIIAGDSAATDSWDYQTKIKHPKVFRNGKFIIGYTHSFRLGDVLRYAFNPP